MSRPVFLSNGSMMVGLDKFGLVNDFYYPYVGLENHSNATNMHHRVGIYVDNKFSWLDDGSWQISVDYEKDATISYIKAHNQNLDISLEFHDFVDYSLSAFIRKIHVVNKKSHARNIKIFMHQVFKISESDRGETALYEPHKHYILDYKGKRSFLIYAQENNDNKFDQYSIGLHGIEGRQGTYADAEDGELECNPVEHGSVDSTLRVNLNIEGHNSTRVEYWVAAAVSHADVEKIHNIILKNGVNTRHQMNQEHWANWLNISSDYLSQIDTKYLESVQKSLFIIKSHIDKRGGILASGDSEMLNYARDNYSYCWPRDAAYALWPLIRLGYEEEAQNFFEFARDVLTDKGALMHKFQPDRAVGSTWHPLVHNGHPELAIQEDETAITMFILYQYFLHSNNDEFVKKLYPTLIQPMANFMEEFIDEDTMLPHASYDLWEEKFLTSTYTVATVYAALRAASKMAEKFDYADDAIRWQTIADDIYSAAHRTLFNKEKQYFYKGYLLNDDGSLDYDDTIDASSLYGAIMFELYPIDHEDVEKSLKTLEEELFNQSPSGGLPRYEYDQYSKSPKPYKGNPWFVTSLWLAQIYNERGDKDKARPIIEWTKKHMLKSGVLSEQIDPETSEFRSVTPLVWSQAEYINSILDISDNNDS